MISTNRQLPWQPVRSDSPMDPLHDECSGIANLDRQLRRPMPEMFNKITAFCIGFALGALTLAFAAALIINRNHQ